MHEGVIVIKDSDCVVPSDYLAAVLKKYDKYMSVAYADPEHNIVRVTRKIVPVLKNITSMMEGDQFRSKRLVMVFSTIDELEQGGEIQPFSIIEGGQNNPLVVAFLDGNFSQFEQTGSTRYGQSLAVEKKIAPEIRRLWKFTGEIPKLWTELQDDVTVNNIVNTMVGERGTITLLNANDEVLHFSVADDTAAMEYEWGWCSNQMGWTEAAAAPAQDEDDPMAAALAGTKSPEVQGPPATKASSRSGSKPLPTIASTQPISSSRTGSRTGSQPPAALAADGKLTGPSVREDGGVNNEDGSVTFAVPDEIMRDPRKKAKWMRKRMEGQLPSNYMELKSITLKNPKGAAPFLKRELVKGDVKILKSFTGLKEMLMSSIGLKPENVPTTPAPAEEPANPTPEVQPQQETAPPRVTGTRSRSRSGSRPATTPVAAQPTTTKTTDAPAEGHSVVVTVPTRAIPPAQKLELAAYLKSDECKAALDRHSQAIADPKTYEALQVKQPNFAQEMKGQIEITSIWDTKNWPEEVIMNMARNTPEASMSYAISWRTVAIKQRQKIEALETRVAGLESQLGLTEPEEAMHEKATGTHGQSRSRSRSHS